MKKNRYRLPAILSLLGVCVLAAACFYSSSLLRSVPAAVAVQGFEQQQIFSNDAIVKLAELMKLEDPKDAYIASFSMRLSPSGSIEECTAQIFSPDGSGGDRAWSYRYTPGELSLKPERKTVAREGVAYPNLLNLNVFEHFPVSFLLEHKPLAAEDYYQIDCAAEDLCTNAPYISFATDLIAQQWISDNGSVSTVDKDFAPVGDYIALTCSPMTKTYQKDRDSELEYEGDVAYLLLMELKR